MTKVSSRGPFPFLTLDELDEVITALEVQASDLAELIRIAHAPPIVGVLGIRYSRTLSLLTAALEFRADEFRGAPERPRNAAAWSGVEFGDGA